MCLTSRAYILSESWVWVSMIINNWLSAEKKWSGVTTKVFPAISLGLGLPAAMHSSTFVLLKLKHSLASMGWTNKGASEVEYWRF